MSRKSCLKWCTLAVVVICMGATVALADAPQGPVKWPQPPVTVPERPDLIIGWDQVSTDPHALVADDFRCEGPLPITDLHWWGSYPQHQPGTPLKDPDSFLIQFWTDVPAGEDPNPEVTWSHPGQPIWPITCKNYTRSKEPVGYDINVGAYIESDGQVIEVVDEAFQYNQTLKPEEYFDQGPGNKIYWISIQAQYDNPTLADVWGWKTRPHFFQDDAVTGGPIGDDAGGFWWQPIDTYGEHWDMAFELTTVPEPSTFVLLAMGAFGLVAYAWRKRRGA